MAINDLFSKKQLQILAFPKTDYDALICDGSIRAGKSSVMSVGFVLWAMQNFNGKNFGICSKTIGTAQRNIIRPLLAMAFIKKRYIIRYVQGEYFELTDAKGRCNTFYIFGGKDESSYQLIQGITLAGVLLDEVALMPRSFVDQALARCSVEGSKLWFNCNPEGQLHWFNQEWILEAKEKNALHLHFTMDDNPSLSEKIKDRYRSMYVGVFYQRYIEGMWVSAEGVIYADMFTDENILTEEQIKGMRFEGEYYVTCDFGIQNPTVFLLWRKVAGEQKYVCLKEYHYSGREERRQKTTSELVNDLKEMLGEIKPKVVIVDPSASALKVELRQKGFKVQDAHNEVLDGIAHTGKLLQDNKLLFSETCKNTIDEFSLYIWDETAAERGEDVPIKENDHCLVGETEIETLFGKRKIKDLVGKIGFVWSYKKGRKVLRPFFKVRQTQKDQKILRILTENGKQICCTPEHRILTERGWVRAKDLTPKDRIIDVMD